MGAAPPSAAPPRISLLVASAENGVIGRDNSLPWHLPEDLKRFKALTMGKPMLMGRKTFESIGKALPGRTSLVLTRSTHWKAPGAVVVHSLPEALARAAGASELMVIGGAEVFRLAMPLAERIYLTRVHAAPEGDVRLPPLEDSAWREVARHTHPVDARHAHAMSFIVLERL
ncbi:MAG TPA: dihydrofolate reductase [Steroidobacteraceae bacterium]|nr:dihydrofolate reductase [Steroidobacteraceae bacterium]